MTRSRQSGLLDSLRSGPGVPHTARK